MFKQKESDDPYRHKCSGYTIEDVQHILFRCPADDVIRSQWFDKLTDVCPQAMYCGARYLSG